MYAIRSYYEQIWTWVAGVYAGGLFLLAISGLLMVSRESGLQRRGPVLIRAGILVPLLFLLVYY